MLRYLIAAFVIRPPVPGVGRVPVNALIALLCAALGYLHPWFWVGGLVYEVIVLVALATSTRFQKLVDAGRRMAAADPVTVTRDRLVAQLIPPTQKRWRDLDARCRGAVETAHQQGVEDYIIDGNRTALDKLQWLYLRLLTARQYLLSQDVPATRTSLRQKIDALRADLGDGEPSTALRQSKEATLAILEKRLEICDRHELTLAEIESDLARIEAQVELAVENVSLSAPSGAVATNISLASHLLDPEVYGPSESLFADLEPALDRTAPPRESA